MKQLSRIGMALLPFAIIAALLYAALFVKPKLATASPALPAIGVRDAFYDVAVPQPGTVWAVGREGKIVRSDDAGQHWTVQPSGTRQNLQSIVAWDARRALVVGNAGTVLRTVDGGASWQSVALKLPDGSLPKLLRVRLGPATGAEASDRLAVAVGELGTVLLSRDLGATWAVIGQRVDVAWNDVALTEGNWLLVGEFGRIRRSVDAGATWAEVPSPVKRSLNGVAWRGDAATGSGVAVGLDGTVLTGSQGGLVWTLTPVPTQAHLFDVQPDGAGWVVAADQGLLLRNDGRSDDGHSWRQQRLAEHDHGWRSSVVAVPAANGATGATGDLLVLAGAGLGAVTPDGKYQSWK